MGDRKNHAAVHQGQAGHGEGRIHADLVGAIAVEQSRIRLGAVKIGAMNNGDGDVGAVGSRGPQAVGHIIIRIITTGNLLLLEQGVLAGVHAVIEKLGGLGKGHIAYAKHRRVPLRVTRYGNGEKLFVEVELFEFAKAVVNAHDGGTADAAAAVTHHNLVAVGIHALDAGGFLMRQQRGQIPESGQLAVGLGIAHLEVGAGGIVGDNPVVLALDDGVIDVVVHAGFTLPQQAEVALGVVLFEHPYLRGHLGAYAKEEVLIRAGAADADVEVLVIFLKHLHVLGLRGAYLVAPNGIGTPCIVDGGVENKAVSSPGSAVENAL